ncbi:MAG: dienelactone hydrolase family protein, partial [Solirubrobacteraceae bacterium]
MKRKMAAIDARSERIAIPDGRLEAHVAVPASGGGPGIVLLHEIFGVNDYVRDAARRLAELGCVVLAPDLYWRTQPGLELNHDEAGVQAGMAAAQRLDVAAAVGDALAALEVLRAMPEV